MEQAQIAQKEPRTVNGKVYPLWNQFVDASDEWHGGMLEEIESNSISGTLIENIDLYPNGETSAVFEVNGKRFTCACDVQYLGITDGEKGWITFSGYGGQQFRIRKPIS